MSRGLVAIALLSACETSGIEIIVKPPAEAPVSIDEVRLFIGIPSELPINLIAPAGFTNRVQGSVWVRDPSNLNDSTPMSGDSVRFVFAPGDDDELGAVIAVGYKEGAPVAAGGVFEAGAGDGHVAVFDIALQLASD